MRTSQALSTRSVQHRILRIDGRPKAGYRICRRPLPSRTRRCPRRKPPAKLLPCQRNGRRNGKRRRPKGGARQRVIDRSIRSGIKAIGEGSSRSRRLSEPCRAGKRNTPPASMDRQRSPASRRENGRHSPLRRQSTTRGWAYETPRSSRLRRADASRNPAADKFQPLRVVTRTHVSRSRPDRVALDSKTTRSSAK